MIHVDVNGQCCIGRNVMQGLSAVKHVRMWPFGACRDEKRNKDGKRGSGEGRIRAQTLLLTNL